MIDRDNETWMAHLDAGSLDRQTALADLRGTLLGGLRKALAHRTYGGDAFLEDVVQDALLRIMERLSQFQGRSRFTTWAMSISIRVAMSQLRRLHWKDVSLDEVTTARVSDKEASLDVQSEREAILAAMQEVIRTGLTEKQRLALLAELRGMPQDEIARHLGSNRNAIYKLTHDARKRLKQGLEALGFTGDDIGAAISG